MPYRCAVPPCKGNYKNETKVHVFSFQKDITLSNIWIRSLKRMDFTPNKFSKVNIFLC